MIRTDYNLPIFEDNDLADLNNYTEELAEALKGQIDRFGNPLTFKGVVATLNDLPLNASAGDIYNVTSINKNYCYSGTEWLEYSEAIDNSCHEMITDKYDSAQAYVVGDYCIYNNVLYKCIATTTGNWDSTKWIETQIMNEFETSKVPQGGTTGQILTKKSNADNDVEWKSNTNVVDNLNSTSSIDALSANQGRILKRKVATLDLSEDFLNPGVYETKIPLDTLTSNTDLLTYADNSIVIGAGISKVLVSGNSFGIKNNTAMGYMWTVLQIQRGTSYINISFALGGENDGFAGTSHSGKLVDVQQGDKILMKDMNGEQIYIRGHNNTYLTVEVIE